VRREDAEEALALASARLEYERQRGTPSGEIDDLTKWFLDTMADPDRSRLLLSRPFIARFETMGGDARAWAGWARNEVARLDQESRQLLDAELARPGAPEESAKPRWRANTAVYTPSHSLKSKVLARWNDQIEAVQLLWSGKKDQFILAWRRSIAGSETRNVLAEGLAAWKIGFFGAGYGSPSPIICSSKLGNRQTVGLEPGDFAAAQRHLGGVG
jgi:hypothetical protein